MNLELEGKTAVVTGASAGIGRAIARCLASEGVRVAVVARRAPLLDELADEIEASEAPRPLVIVADTTDNAQQDELIKSAVTGLGGIDILVNCAGGRLPSGLSGSDEEWDAVMTLNFESQRRLTTRVWRGMQDRGFGRIIYVTGKSEPECAGGAYCAKAAMHAWAKGLSRDLGPFGITVNSIAPGRILSEQMARHYSEEQRAAHAREIPIGRYGTVDEIARVAAFLASPQAAYLTGTVIPVDGGLRRYQF